MVGEQTLIINGPVGPIESRLYLPLSSPQRLAVVCHPHPLHHGTMNNKVVTTVCRSFKQASYAYLRFNFRGIGQSAGDYDHAVGEIDDCLSVISYVKAQFPDCTIVLAGFSFGSYIAYQAARQHSPLALILVAPPVNHFPFEQRVAVCPYWVVQGAEDDVVPVNEVQAWVAKQQTSPTYIEMAETGHFFHGQLVALREQLVAAIMSL